MDSLKINTSTLVNSLSTFTSDKSVNSDQTVNKIAYKQDNTFFLTAKDRFAENQTLQDVLSGRTLLGKGSKGESVKIVQKALLDMGFYIGDNTDGVFGNQTEIALKNFQDSRKISVTGILDQQTMVELNKISPPENKKIWSKEVKRDFVNVPVFPSNLLENGKRAKIVIDLSQHRLFLFDENNEVQKAYSIASGNKNHPDRKGVSTSTGIKVVNYKYDDPSPVARKLWPETNGRAFGTKMLDLSWLDLKTGKTKGHGEELHGTFDRKSIGTDASHGCMRMQNEDVEEIYKLVKKGDIVKIQE